MFGQTIHNGFCQSFQIREIRTQTPRSQHFRRGLGAVRCRTASCCRRARFSSTSAWRDLKTMTMACKMIERMRAMVQFELAQVQWYQVGRGLREAQVVEQVLHLLHGFP